MMDYVKEQFDKEVSEGSKRLEEAEELRVNGYHANDVAASSTLAIAHFAKADILLKQYYLEKEK